MPSKRFSRLARICIGTSSSGAEELLQLEGRLERFVHFWTLVVHHFVKNRCLVRAEALAYTTLLALIPLLAVAVGITSTLLKSEGEDQIYRAIDRFVSTVMPPAAMTANGQVTNTVSHSGFFHSGTPNISTNPIIGLVDFTNLPAISPVDTNLVIANATTNGPANDRVVTVQKEAAKNIHDYIQNAQSGKLGITGMIVFVFIAIGMLRRVEDTFNDIWGVNLGRQWWHQISSYFTIVALGPVVLIAAASLAGGNELSATHNLVERIPFLGRFTAQILPLLFLWLVFALFYMLVPNTKVKFSAAFIGGMVAGTLWHLNNVFAFFYVSRVITNSQIYGKLGLVPVFMLGLYFSWVILLFGAQVAYAFQNRVAYLQERIADNVNQRGREFVALRIMTLLGQRFQTGQPPAPVIELSSELGVPSRLTQRILRTLASAQLVTEVAGDGDAYIPARPLETINAHHILHALRTGSGQELLMEHCTELTGIYGDFARIEAAERTAAENVTLLALVQHLPASFSLLTPDPQLPETISTSVTAAKPKDPQALSQHGASPKSEPTPPIAEVPKPIDVDMTAARPTIVVVTEGNKPPSKIIQPADTDFPL